MATRLITIKVAPDTRQMLRVLAAHSSKPMHQVADELAWAEMKKRKLPLTTKGTRKERK